ncbi:retropepsin-like aspartic protease family protein [Enterovirga rhinocerotis]|uniref:Aspartyl protease family protein n=1 Tax=Enterovirga rhinocerotis TaxID=1339210 RepID=A0A4V3DWM5_9HYPH|nr:TIGR02281 family clan AA aspartic protease [Enterovirga rhinocerotis]TDR85419.1 aspartyl protease family protein [Enterovirga rhinocerotis]
MTRVLTWAAGTACAAALAASLAGERLAGLVATREGPEKSVAAPARQPFQEPRSVSVLGDGRGHFAVEASVDGQVVPMLVDTGASLVVLREEDARNLGIRPSRAEFTGRAQTANGTVETAPVRIRSLKVGGIEIRDVEAAIVPEGRLGMNLLGMSYLRRLKGFEIAGNRLLLRG